MEEVFEFQGQEYTLAEVQNAAKAKSLNIDDYIKEYNISRKEGKTTPTAPGAVVEETAAPDMDSKLESGLLEYTKAEPLEEFKEKKSIITEEGTAELRQAGDGKFQPIELEEVVVEGKDKTKIKEARDRDIRIKTMSAITKMPETGVSITAGLAATTVDIFNGFTNLVDKFGVAPVNYAIGKALGYDTTLRAEVDASIDNYEVFENVSNLLRQYTLKKYDKEGNEQDIVSLIEKDNYVDAAELAFNEGFSAAPYLALSIASPIYGSALIGASVTGQEVQKALKERPDASLSEIYGASILKGGVEFATNAIGGGLQRGILGIGKRLGTGTNAYKKAVDIYTKTYLGKVAESGIGLTKGGATNFIEEWSASMGNALVDAAVYNDPFEFKSANRQALNEGLVGLALGSPVGSLGAFNSLASKQQALEFLAPKKWHEDIAKQNVRLEQAKIDLNNAPLNRKEKFQKRVQKIESLIKMKKQQLQNSFDNLTKKEKKQYADNLNKSAEALSQIGNSKYTLDAQNIAKEDFNEANKQNEILVGKEIFDSEAEKFISKTLKNTERINEAFQKAKQNVKNVKFEYISDINAEFDARFDPNTNTVTVNKPIAIKAEQTNVIGHELLHYMINQKFATDNTSMQPLVDSFKDYLKETQPELYQRVQERIDENYTEINEQGQKVIKEGALEEYFNVFSDLVAKEKIIVNESLSDKIKNTTTRFLNGLGFGSIKLETGKDVFNFIRNYQKNISNFKFKQLGVDLKSSKIPEAVQKVVEEGKQSFSKSKASDKVQEIYEAQGAANAFDIIAEFKPIVDRIVNKYRDVPGFEYQLLKDEIETGKRGILDMIMEYTPEKAKGAPLAAYINKYLSRRAIEAANRILGTEFTLDVTEAKGVTDTTTEEVTEATEEAVIADEIKSLRKEIGLPEELINTVKKAVIKTFGTKLPNPQDSKFRLELQKRFRTELKKPMAKFVGKQEAYESFLRDNFKAIYNKLPQSLINRRFKDFAEPVLDENGKQMRERTAEGNKIFTKKKITPAEFIKYFLGSDVGRSTQGTRKTAIVEAIAEEIAFDATMEVLRDPNVINKYQEIAGITGEVLPENFKAVIAKQIDRAEGFKFSKSLSNIAKEEYNLEQQELSKILDKNNLNNLSNKYPLLSDNIIYEADPSNIKFSLTTKAEGEWVTNPLAPLADYSKNYKFKVGDVGYEIFVTRSSEAGYDYEIFEMSNDIPDDTIINDPKSIALAFADERGRTRITGESTIGLTNQFKVFGTVANSVIDLIKKDNLNSVTFSAKEKSRQRLYQSLNKKFADELGWDTYDFEDAEEGLTFIAYNPKAFSVEPQITPPPPVKFSMSANNKFNVTAKELLRNPKAWAEYSNNILNGSQIYQNYIGSIETSLGSVRPSNVIKYEAVPGFGKLNNKEVIEFKEKIKELQQKIVAQKVTNTKNMLQPGDSYKNPAKVFGRTPNQFLNKIKDGTIFKNTKAYQRIYRDMWGEYFNMLADNSEIYDFLELTLNNSNLDISHWHRLGALFVGFDQGALEVPLLDKNGKPRYGFNSRTKTKFPLTRFVEFEHAVQNHIQWDRVLKAAAKFAKKNDKKGFIEYLEKSMKDYVLIGMAYTDARKVDKAGFAHIMPQGWKRWWDRYFNNKVAKIDGGINPNNISFIEYTDTKANIKSNIGKQFNINDSKGNIKLSKSLNKEFNEQILQATTGVPYYETFSPVKARLMGKGKGKKFFIPYSADDFVGLLYATLGKREVGDQQMEWYQQNLLRPFSRGIQQYEAAKQRALRDWMALKKEAAKNVPGGLNKTNDSGFTNQNSVRVYIWNKQGMDIPGMQENDISANLKAVNDNPKLKEFGDRLIALNPEGYPEPSKEWDSGDITTDLVTYINDVKRSEFLTEWKENVDEIFNDQNKNKLRALYGDRFVEALEDIITRMKTGRNRRNVSSRTENAVMNWTNNSVGAIMFFNARSAVLQTLSMVNFINFSDNNPINAGAALANFPQYVKDFATLFNSDFLKQRRTGLQTDVNADEIAKAAATAENKARAILSSLLKFGFTPTQIADSFAIASGGATFYRNRIKTYKKQGLEQADAEAKAFTDFQEIAEETQQSARPDRISMQQAGSLGRIILAFANTPMQYARLTKKAALDLYNGRGDWKTNLSKIAYYSVIQNIIFSALQQGLFALLFDDEEEDKEKERYFRMANSSLDTLLRGTGVYGAGVATIKNVILEIIDQQKSKRPDYTKVVIEATSFSPPINSKLRKLESAGKVFTYKQSREKVYTEGFSLENPAFLAAGKVISAGTNLPADRIVQKAQHLKTAFEPETELWQSIALAMGWSEWDLGMIEKQTKKESKISRTRTRTRTRTRKRN